MGYQESLQHEIVKVLELGPNGARCTTQYGSELTIRWGANLPDPAPAVGEMWMVGKHSIGQWSFVSKLHSGSYSVMRYEIELDARECVGTERVVADDIAKIGVDGVFLTVADCGVVMWDSEIADEFGLKSFGDHVSQIVNRFREYGIPVTLVIADTLWSDTTDPIHGMFQQVYIDKDGAYVRSDKASWAGAANAVAALVAELFTLYGDYARGVCIKGISSAGESGDFSLPMRKVYFDRFGHEPYADMSNRPAEGQDDWWRRRVEWQTVCSGALGDFLVGVKSGVGEWAISAMPPSIAVMNSESGRKTGRLSTMLDDDFARMGWSNVIIPIDFSRHADASSELRSFEFCLAQAMRFAYGSTFFARLDIGSIREPDGIFEIMSKYAVKNVLLGSYEKWRGLSDERVIAMKEAMGRYRVVDVDTTQMVGILESHDSRDIAYYSIADNNRYCMSMEGMAASMLDRLPHRLRVIYDKDIESNEGLMGVSSVIVLCAQGITDDAITKIIELVGGGIADVAIIGQAGGGSDSAGSIRVIDAFGAKAYGDVAFGKTLNLNRVVDIADTSWAIDAESVGSNVVIGETVSNSMVQDASLAWQDAAAPVIIKDRSVLVAMDVVGDDAMVDAAASIAAYSIGRNG